MFGYIVVNKQELKIREYEEYRAVYCGLCRELGERFGVSGQLTLNYDLTFVILLLTGLYGEELSKEKHRCVVHPIRKHEVVRNDYTTYAADMNLFLSYYKCRDDWDDERKLDRYLYARLLQRSNRKVCANWKQKTARIEAWLKEMSDYEKSGEENPDVIAGLFGKIMGEILAVEEDVWEETLRKMGFFLGKFIYLLDAYDDVEEDIRKGSYNVFRSHYQNEDFDEEVREILMLMMAECCREFELLPVIEYAEIIRNILYSGIWSRYQTVFRKRREKREKK